MLIERNSCQNYRDMAYTGRFGQSADDMPAHAKSTLSGVSITIPITDGRLNLGTWQGIYFCEYRNYGGSRELVVTIIGE